MGEVLFARQMVFIADRQFLLSFYFKYLEFLSILWSWFGTFSKIKYFKVVMIDP